MFDVAHAVAGERPLYVLARHGQAGPQSDAASDTAAARSPRSPPLTLPLRVRLISGGLYYALRFGPGAWGLLFPEH